MNKVVYINILVCLKDWINTLANCLSLREVFMLTEERIQFSRLICSSLVFNQK